MSGIFFPVDGCHMGWIFIKVRSPDSELRVRIDPVPQFLICGPSLCIIVTIYADKISREPVAIAAAKTPAVVRPGRRSLQTTCEGLTVIVTECACYARRVQKRVGDWPRYACRVRRSVSWLAS